MDSETNSSTILMFPWLAHGHIFPFLELAKRILKKKKFHIQLYTTSINFSSISQFIQANSLEASIDLVELHLEPNPLLPPHYHTTKNLPPNLYFSLITALQTTRSSFSDIITTLKPDLVIFDVLQPWAATLAASQGIPAVHFYIGGGATWSFNLHRHHTCGDDQSPFPELYLQENESRSQDFFLKFVYENVFEKDKDLFFVNSRLSCEFVLIKASMALEGKYVDYASDVGGKKMLAVGPLVSDKNEEGNSDILQWLSKKDEHSTVYISFGSEYFLSKEEIVELAKGVELSGVNFIWVIRLVEGSTTSLKEALPEGFLERMGERGRVVSGWVPQASILGHPSTGAFVSHCGWSSLNESVYYGVPVVGLPVRLVNMFIDARMLVHVGACVEVVRDENGEFYKGEEIAKAINEVIVEERGEKMRQRVRELGEKMRIEEEGAIEETAECLWQLCCKNKGKE